MESNLGDFTRGGQIILHFIRMTKQVIKNFFVIFLFLYIAIVTSIFFYTTSYHERYLTTRYISANIGIYVYDNGNNFTKFKDSNGKTYRIKLKHLVRYKKFVEAKEKVVSKLIVSAIYATLIIVACIPISSYLMASFGKRKGKDLHLRGRDILETKEFEEILKKEGKASHLKVAGIPLINGTETSHILLSGAPGTGKSTTIYEMMKLIRERGDRAITYSPSGDFIERYFEDGDHVFNPFDIRCKSWNLWDECSHSYQFDMLAEAMVPASNSGDQFWNNAARQLISSILSKMKERGNNDLKDFLNILIDLELSSLHSFLSGSSAAALIEPENPKMAASIRSTAVIYAQSFRFIEDLQNKEESFNIRNWVSDDSGSDWVYLMAKPDQISSTRPLLSAWLEIFTNSIMSLPTSMDRRIWLILDELPSLNKIPSLGNFLAQSRKYGGCGIIAFQQFSQLKERYGMDGAESLAGLCATWVCMRQNDPETARWIAQSFGEKEIKELQHGLSYGASDIRDGENLNLNRKKIEIILPSQIGSLNNLEGYIRLPGDFPVAHFKLDYKKSDIKSEAFIPREMEINRGPTAQGGDHQMEIKEDTKIKEIKEYKEERDPDDTYLFGDFDESGR